MCIHFAGASVRRNPCCPGEEIWARPWHSSPHFHWCGISIFSTVEWGCLHLCIHYLKCNPLFISLDKNIEILGDFIPTIIILSYFIQIKKIFFRTIFFSYYWIKMLADSVEVQRSPHDFDSKNFLNLVDVSCGLMLGATICTVIMIMISVHPLT